MRRDPPGATAPSGTFTAEDFFGALHAMSRLSRRRAQIFIQLAMSAAPTLFSGRRRLAHEIDSFFAGSRFCESLSERSRKASRTPAAGRSLSAWSGPERQRSSRNRRSYIRSRIAGHRAVLAADLQRRQARLIGQPARRPDRRRCRAESRHRFCGAEAPVRNAAIARA